MKTSPGQTVLYKLCVILLLFCVIVPFASGQDDTPPLEDDATSLPAPADISNPVPGEAPANLPTQDAESIPIQATDLSPTDEVAVPTQDADPNPTDEVPVILTQESAAPIATEETASLPLLIPALPLLLLADFEANYPIEWAQGSAWPFVKTDQGQAVQYIDGASLRYQGGTLTDVSVSAHILLKSGSLHIFVRQSSLGAYRLVLSSDTTLSLYRGEVLLQSIPTALNAESWFALRFEVIGSTLSISIDGITLIILTDIAPLSSGMVTISADAGSLLRLDDLALYGVPDGAMPFEQPVLAPTAIATVLPTALPTQDMPPIPAWQPIRTYDFLQAADWTLRDWTHNEKQGVLVASQSQDIAELQSLPMTDAALEAAVTSPASRFRIYGRISYEPASNRMRSYIAQYSESGISLMRDGRFVASTPPLALNLPTTMRLEMVGGLITVFLNGRSVLTYSDPAPLPAGTFGLQAPDSWVAENTPPVSVLVDAVTIFLPTSAVPNPGAPAGKSTIGDRVWLDADKDGIQDPGESGVANVSIELWKDDTLDTKITTLKTNSSGLYSFLVASGYYYLKIIVPAGYILTNPNATTDTNDSDFVAKSYRTATQYFASTVDDWSWDAGLVALNRCPADTTLEIALVLDGSSSIGATNFDAVRNFAIGVVDSFSIGAAATRFSLIQFSSTTLSKQELALSADRAALIAKINTMVYQNGSTDIHKGLALGQASISTTTTRKIEETPRIIILFTDGVHNGLSDALAQAQIAKDAKTIIYTVGVGAYSQSQLEAIASGPAETHVFTMSTFSQLINSLEGITSAVCGTAIVPYPAPKMAAPLIGVYTADTSPTLTWTAIRYAAARFGGSYELLVDDNNSFNDPDILVYPTGTSYTGDLLPNRLYYWKVRAWNPIGASSWSIVNSFMLQPIAPTLTAPLANAALTIGKPAFAWSFIATSGATRYRIQIDTTADFNSPYIDKTFAPPSTTATKPGYVPAVPLQQGGNYWRVQAIDPSNNVGPWSSVRYVTLNSATAPVDNAFLPIVGTGKPEFKWTSLAGATQIRIQVASSETFDTIVRDMPVTPLTAINLLTSSANALPWGVYWWRLAVDVGEEIQPSPYKRKLTITPPAPPAPALSLPAAATYTRDTTPTLSWTASAYAYPGVTLVYEYEIDNKGTVLSPDFHDTTPDLAATSAQLADGVYSWRVRAINTLNYAGAWSSSRVLTIDTHNPAPPAMLAPLQGVISIARPAYSWNRVSDGGTTTYDLQVDDDSGFASPDVDLSSIPTPATVSTTMSYIPTITLKQMEQYWRVRAIDQAGNISPWSTPIKWTVNSLATPANNFVMITNVYGAPTFSWTAIPMAKDIRVQVSTSSTFDTLIRDIQTPLPTATSLVMSGVNALPFDEYYWRLAVNLGGGVQVSPFSRKLIVTPPAPAIPGPGLPLTATFLNTATPTLSWAVVPYAYTGVSLTYEFEIDNNSNFASRELTGSTADLSVVLAALPDGLYYWRVRANNGLGQMGGWSVAKSFTIDTLLPGMPSVITPGSLVLIPTITTIRPTYSWTPAASGIMTYHLQVDNDASFASPAVDLYGIKTTSLIPVTSLTQGLYYMRVQATDQAGNTGPYSLVASFSVNSMLLPADHTSVATLTTLVPTFTWAALPGATQIRVQVSTSSTFETLMRDVPTSLPTSVSLVMGGVNALPPGEYYWRLAVNLGSGLQVSPFSRKLTILASP